MRDGLESNAVFTTAIATTTNSANQNHFLMCYLKSSLVTTNRKDILTEEGLGVRGQG